MAQALIAFALQAKLSISHTGIDFHDAMANPVEGRLRPSTAMAQLLAGSRYEYVFLDDETVQIRLAEPTKPTVVTNAEPVIDEIIVTATKRPEISRLLPNSMAVVSGSDIDNGGLKTATDLATGVSGLVATNLGAGQDKLFIRGLSDSTFSGRSQSTVGLYLDESRVTDDAPDPGLRLVDINRIEILRGPQGTLYGGGALGGVIRIITNQPATDRTQAMAGISSAFTDHGNPSGGADAMLNLPIIDDVLALRVVGYVNRDGGYIDDTRLARSDVNRTDTDGLRAALRWQPDNDWTVTLGATDQAIYAADSQYSQSNLPPLTRANYVPEPHRDQFLQGNITVEGQFELGTLTSASAVTERRIGDQFDATREWPSLTGFAAGPSRFNDVRDIQSITHETRFSSKESGDWSWLAGLFLTDRDEDYTASLIGPNRVGQPINARAEARADHADEAALFGDASYAFTPYISATAGTRFYYSTLSASSQIYASPPAGFSTAGGRNDATGILPSIVLDIRPSSALLVYLSAAEGVRLGGINIDSPNGAVNIFGTPPGGDSGEKAEANAFASDTLWTYEVGAKASLLDGRLTASTAAWLSFWDNVQSDQILSNGSLYIADVGNVRDPGFEADFEVQPIDRLALQGNFFWNDPKIIHANPFLIQTDGRLPGVPQISFGTSTRYDYPVFGDYDASIRFDYSYIGKSHVGFDVKNSPEMGNYFTANLRLGLFHDPWQATLYVNNITNEQANTLAYGNPFSFGRIGQITPVRPLTVGLQWVWTY